MLKPSNDDVEAEVSMTAEEEVSPLEKSLIYEIVTPEVLWDCTNCGGCIEHCPMFIEHISKIVDMRRNLSYVARRYAQ